MKNRRAQVRRLNGNSGDYSYDQQRLVRQWVRIDVSLMCDDLDYLEAAAFIDDLPIEWIMDRALRTEAERLRSSAPVRDAVAIRNNRRLKQKDDTKRWIAERNATRKAANTRRRAKAKKS